MVIRTIFRVTLLLLTVALAMSPSNAHAAIDVFSDPGTSLMIARHAIAQGGFSTVEQTRLLTRTQTTLANDPIAASISERLTLQTQPDDLPTLRTVIAADLIAQAWSEALAHLAHLAVLIPGDAQTRFQLAMLLVRTDPTAAQSQLQALSADPQFGALATESANSLRIQPITLARRTIGVQLAGAGQWSLAVALLEPTLTIYPQDSVARALLGLSLESQGLNGYPLIAQAVIDAPADPLVRYTAALHFQQSGDSQAALQFLLQTVDDPALAATSTQRGEFYAAIAFAYTQENRLPLAAQFYEKAVTLDPQNPTFAEQLAAFYANQHYQPEAGLAFVQSALNLYPQDASLYASLAQIQLDTTQTTVALQSARRAVALAPGLAYTQLILGRCLDQSGDHVAAQVAYSAAYHTVDPNGGNYRQLAAQALSQPANQATSAPAG